MLNAFYTTADLGAVDTAVLSVGSTEQCGPNLPLDLDTLVAGYYARAFGRALNAYVLPTLPFNTAEEHMTFKGTVSLRPTTVMLLLEEIVVGLNRQRFTKFVLTSGHGGAYWLGAFIKDMNYRYPHLLVANAHHSADTRWRDALQRAGLDRGELHGGVLSRALAAFLAPGHLKEGEFGHTVSEEQAAFMDYVGWEKLTPDGSWGRYNHADREIATAEAGRLLLEHFTHTQSAYLKSHLAAAVRLKGL